MDIGFDWTEWRPALDAGLPGNGWAGSPDWQVLRSRLGAAWLARQALDAPSAAAALPRGSFAPAAARALGGLGETLCAVNRTALGNCKPGAAIDVADAGISLAGGRGLI
jgi:hypothetical protein